MEFAPILISIKTACVAIVITFVVGTWFAYVVYRAKNGVVRSVADALLTLPLVLPPTVAGFFLLYIFGVYRPIGSLLANLGVKIVFSWPATVLAAVVIALPLMYRSAKAAFTQVDPIFLQAARTIGMSEGRIAFRILFPLASPGLVSGGILAFSRGLGEFGATAMIAGNIAGVTRTMPLAIYSSVSGGRVDEAYRYVIILVLISFIFVVLLNFVSDVKSNKYRLDSERR
ncbi:MAG: molybdate ABC transporter permease subunit [Clostridiales Family XIII bacterium]|jgi:molybdate transport system permease protein|nr:molybdate ABC transporter permease subunit [Clostridiales Family XIII bacterium]